MIEIERQDQAQPAASEEKTASTPLHLEICGVTVSVEGLDAALRERLADVLNPFVIAPSSPRDEATGARLRVWWVQDENGWRLAPDDYTSQFFGDPQRLVTQLEWQAMVHAHELSAGLALFHGAALARGNDVVLLLGETRAGKTTLTLGLMQRGWLPLTDDVLVVDRESLCISAFPRCFHVSREIAARLADRTLLEWLGNCAAEGEEEYARPVRWAEEARPPTCIVTVERRADGPSECSPISYAEAASRLAASTLANRLGKRERVAVAAHLAAGARRCVRLVNGDLDGALDLIERMAHS